jgi:hypothetical protein
MTAALAAILMLSVHAPHAGSLGPGHCERRAKCLVVQLIWDSPVNAVEPLWTYNIIEAVTFGGGTTCFFIGAILFLARQVRLCELCLGAGALLCMHRAARRQLYTFLSAPPQQLCMRGSAAISVAASAC